MTTDAIYEERGSHWSQQVSDVATTQWLQCDQAIPLSTKGVACENSEGVHLMCVCVCVCV